MREDFPTPLIWSFLAAMALTAGAPSRDWWLRRFSDPRRAELARKGLRMLKRAAAIVFFLLVALYLVGALK
jgi:hypothetical protein